MPVQLRPITRDELPAWLAAMLIGFLREDEPAERAAAQLERYARSFDPERTLGGVDGGRVVATFRSYTTELTVPGGVTVPANAITNITVAPTHRRRGLLRELMERDLAAVAGRGEPLSILVAAEWPIYGRYGFGPAADIAGWQIDARAARFVHGGSGEVELVDAETACAAGAAIYEAHRRTTPGAIVRDAEWWRLATGLDPAAEPAPAQRLALVRDEAGTPTGLLRYQAEGEWQQWRPRGKLTVDDLVAATPEAEARLWRYACEVDLVATVVAGDRAVDERLPWLLADARDARQTYRSDFLWLRLHDVCASLEARRYQREGSLVLEVEDPIGLAAGRYALEVDGDGAARCVATDAAPDLTLSSGALGAAYLGGRALATMASGSVEHRAGARELFDALFHTPVAPWCATLF